MRRYLGQKSPDRRTAIEDAATFDADTLIPAVEDLGGAPRGFAFPLHFAEFRKTQTTFAVQIDEPFEVETLEGIHTGKAGDWLAVGAQGEMYPIDAEVFAVTYEPVE